MGRSEKSEKPKASHTPGEWVARLGEFDYGNDGSRRIMVGSVETEQKRIGTVDSQIERKARGKNATPYNAPDAERDANASLFAAAPELLALVMDAIEDADEFETEWNKSARAAIAKALGK